MRKLAGKIVPVVVESAAVGVRGGGAGAGLSAAGTFGKVCTGG